MKTKLPLAVAALAVASFTLTACTTEAAPAEDMATQAPEATPEAEAVEETPEPEAVEELSPAAQEEVASMFRTAQMVFYSAAETNVGEQFRKVLTGGNEIIVMLGNDSTFTIPTDDEGWSVIVDGTTDEATVRVSNVNFSENPDDHIIVELVREGLEGPGTEILTGNGKYAGAQVPAAQ